MRRIHLTLALATLLGSAPLAAPAFAAEPAHVTMSTSAAPGVDLSAPATPIPMNLPDDATADEVSGQYGIGIAGLIMGTLLVAAIVVGGFYVVSRQSWSASH